MTSRRLPPAAIGTPPPSHPEGTGRAQFIKVMWSTSMPLRQYTSAHSDNASMRYEHDAMDKSSGGAEQYRDGRPLGWRLPRWPTTSSNFFRNFTNETDKNQNDSDRGPDSVVYVLRDQREHVLLPASVFLLSDRLRSSTTSCSACNHHERDKPEPRMMRRPLFCAFKYLSST